MKNISKRSKKAVSAEETVIFKKIKNKWRFFSAAMTVALIIAGISGCSAGKTEEKISASYMREAYYRVQGTEEKVPLTGWTHNEDFRKILTELFVSRPNYTVQLDGKELGIDAKELEIGFKLVPGNGYQVKYASGIQGNETESITVEPVDEWYIINVPIHETETSRLTIGVKQKISQIEFMDKLLNHSKEITYELLYTKQQFARLNNIVVETEGAQISPEFNANTTGYNVFMEDTQETVKITWEKPVNVNVKVYDTNGLLLASQSGNTVEVTESGFTVKAEPGQEYVYKFVLTGNSEEDRLQENTYTVRVIRIKPEPTPEPAKTPKTNKKPVQTPKQTSKPVIPSPTATTPPVVTTPVVTTPVVTTPTETPTPMPTPTPIPPKPSISPTPTPTPTAIPTPIPPKPSITPMPTVTPTPMPTPTPIPPKPSISPTPTPSDSNIELVMVPNMAGTYVGSNFVEADRILCSKYPVLKNLVRSYKLIDVEGEQGTVVRTSPAAGSLINTKVKLTIYIANTTDPTTSALN